MILLARHGETDDNRPPARVQGHTATRLNARGRVQAEALAERVAGQGIVALYCSHLARARETAEIVGAKLDLEPRVDSRFAETDRGAWEGLTWQEIERRDPDRFSAWLAAAEGFRFPGGESLADQLQRVGAALDDVEAAGDLPALVVCHGGTIRVALCRRDPRGLRAFHDPDVPNGAVFTL
jgi:broad specificity phosphatase PhoE